jgi:tetratricopeptide (TPR) repeat protein
VVDDAGSVLDAGAPPNTTGSTAGGGGAVDASAAPTDGRGTTGPDPDQTAYDRELQRAEGFARRGDFGRSVRAYKAAIALRGDSVTAHLGLGEAYYELDNLTAALLHLERARVLAPRDPQVYVLLGAVYQSAARRTDAIQAYERYLALAPDGKMATDVRAILRGLKN